jgi:hypothetical protein
MVDPNCPPDHLLVLFIAENGQAEAVYNGPGDLAWENAGEMQKNGKDLPPCPSSRR